ncbi:hypothetical protein TWF173_010533 [Orbilia oligospora]|nr:hypothetical protein TWF173_010533 [Orbilia oligospora]
MSRSMRRARKETTSRPEYCALYASQIEGDDVLLPDARSAKTARQAAVLSGNMEIKLVDSDTLIRTNFDKVTWAANQATALGSRNFQEAEGGGSGRNLMFYCDMREKPEPRPQERTSSNSKDSGRCPSQRCRWSKTSRHYRRWADQAS